MRLSRAVFLEPGAGFTGVEVRFTDSSPIVTRRGARNQGIVGGGISIGIGIGCAWRWRISELRPAAFVALPSRAFLSEPRATFREP
jgi:hypothetical protein